MFDCHSFNTSTSISVESIDRTNQTVPILCMRVEILEKADFINEAAERITEFVENTLQVSLRATLWKNRAPVSRHAQALAIVA